MSEPIKITIDLAQIKGLIPDEFGPVLDNAVAVFQAWLPEQLKAWIALAKQDPDSARAALLAAMNDEAVVAQILADGAAFDADVVRNADNIKKWEDLLKQFWTVLLIVASGLIKVLL